MSSHQVKKVKQFFFRNLELRYMFLGQILQRTRKMTLKHFLKHQYRSKNKIRKITVKSRNDVKSRALQWNGNPYGNRYGLEMDGNGSQFVKRLWIGLDLGEGHQLKTIQ